MYEQMSNSMALGRDEEAYELLLSGVKSKPHQLAMYCLTYYYWCSQVKKWPEPVGTDYMNKLMAVACRKNNEARR